jgi:hypothetical protein
VHNNGLVGAVIPTGIEDVAFAYAVSGRSVELVWYLPAQAGYFFDVYRSTAAPGGGEFERMASGVGVDVEGRLSYADRTVEAGVRYVYRLEAAEGSGSYETPVIYVPVTRAGLGQNYPNPFNPVTRIAYWVPEGSVQEVELVVYDVRGARVRGLVSGPVASGKHVVEWDGRNDGGQTVSSGVYFYRLVEAGFTDTKKMLLIK